MTRIFNTRKLYGSVPCPRFLAPLVCRIGDRLGKAWDYDERPRYA